MAPSFESLAQSVTQDIHPRILLDELCHLGLAKWDVDANTVSLQRSAFVSSADLARMLALLGANVGDHLQAAVANVLGDSCTQSESLHALRPMIAAQWATLFARMAPLLEQSIAADHDAGRVQNQRLCIGFYSYAEPMAASKALSPLPAHSSSPTSNDER